MIYEKVKYRLYPTEKQIKLINLELKRQHTLWNNFLKKQKKYYRKRKYTKSYNEMCLLLPAFMEKRKIFKGAKKLVAKATLKHLANAISYNDFNPDNIRNKTQATNYIKFDKSKFEMSGDRVLAGFIGEIKMADAWLMNGNPVNITIHQERDYYVGYVTFTLGKKNWPST